MSVTEAIDAAWDRLRPALEQADAIIAGCGLGLSEITRRLTEHLLLWLTENPKPAVLDADALNLLAEKRSAKLPDAVVLTPHVGEAARLLRSSSAYVLGDLPGAARAIRRAYGGTVVLKSDASVMVGADGEAINPFGTAGMAKGGSGDTLAGVLGAMLAGQAAYGLKGIRLLQSGCALHGLAGQAAALAYGERGMLATDLCEALGRVPGKVVAGLRHVGLSRSADGAEPALDQPALPKAGDRMTGVLTKTSANAAHIEPTEFNDPDTLSVYIASGEAESLTRSGAETRRAGMPVAANDPRAALGRRVRVTVDRPLGSRHPEHRELLYGLNYGYVAEVLAADNEWQDAYVLGAEEPLEVFEGEVVAVIHRLNDVEDKWVVAAPGTKTTEAEVRARTAFAERFYQSEIWLV